ncbi:MAG TPA: hypothetical protein VND45_06840 [Thermoanaerobaculia bacterium]|jgi:hypothetical protein|nr:hypothetical protein [Thermoanaerobaculia bacterium]
MRDPRYRFSDDVRVTTRAIALRMVHAGTVVTTAEQLEASIASTDDIRERLAGGGYGRDFTAADLFPLFESYVAKASAAKASSPKFPPAAKAPHSMKWLWIAAIAVVAAMAIAVIVGMNL